mmetsp:Transcript_17084/g.33026  ORF Transcript_17084/g.33026 Transcript_17084/m.33026 type:complete len:160 (-) Transcript_17084:950-1429(-)
MRLVHNIATGTRQILFRQHKNDSQISRQVASVVGGQCKHCPPDTPKLSPREIHDALKHLPKWVVSHDGTAITRSFVAKNWVSAMNFFNSVSEIAEASNHHPDFHLTGYRNVEVQLSTHTIGGVAQVDIDMATKLDQIPIEYSLKWLKAQQQGVGTSTAT